MWYDQPLLERAPKGGVDEFGRHYRGGEFLPYYIPREVMPQIDEEDYPEFLKFLLDQNLTVHGEECDPRTLRAHQRVSVERALAMSDEEAAKRALVSADRYTLDGNHRWKRHVIRGTKMTIYRIGLTFEAAIDVLFRFPKTYSYGDGAFHPIRS